MGGHLPVYGYGVPFRLQRAWSQKHISPCSLNNALAGCLPMTLTRNPFNRQARLDWSRSCKLLAKHKGRTSCAQFHPWKVRQPCSCFFFSRHSLATHLGMMLSFVAQSEMRGLLSGRLQLDRRAPPFVSPSAPSAVAIRPLRQLPIGVSTVHSQASFSC